MFNHFIITIDVVSVSTTSLPTSAHPWSSTTQYNTQYRPSGLKWYNKNITEAIAVTGEYFKTVSHFAHLLKIAEVTVKTIPSVL